MGSPEPQFLYLWNRAAVPVLSASQGQPPRAENEIIEYDVQGFREMLLFSHEE